MPKAAKLLPELGENCFVKEQATAKRARRNFPRDVVFSRPESAGCDHNFRAPDCVFDRFFQTRIIIANDGFEFYFNAYAVEFFGEPETIGVGAVGSKQLRTNRNYFGYIFKIITLFREALNKFKPGDDRLTFPKNVEYTEVRNAELCPDICNDFISDFLDTAHYFGMKDENERNEVVDLMQHLCQWLFENGQTTSRLSLL